MTQRCATRENSVAGFQAYRSGDQGRYRLGSNMSLSFVLCGMSTLLSPCEAGSLRRSQAWTLKWSGWGLALARVHLLPVMLTIQLM
jgi:hypothetical protein